MGAASQLLPGLHGERECVESSGDEVRGRAQVSENSHPRYDAVIVGAGFAGL